MVARDVEFRRALASLDHNSEFQGVALVGDSGVGKTMLARAVAEDLTSRGYTVRYVLGTETGARIPLGAFCRSISVEAAPHDPAGMLVTAYHTLEQEENLVLVVDYAQRLDPLSAVLVNQLAIAGAARLIVTIRSDEPAPDAVTALLRERLLLTLHIRAFTPEQSAMLIREVLDDDPGLRLIDHLHSQTGGNPLFLHGLLRAGRRTNTLVRTDGQWGLRGALHQDPELLDMVKFRLEALSLEELEAVEVLATAELIDWDILRALCDIKALEILERRGLIQITPDRSHTMVHLTHPILGEGAMKLAGEARRRQLNAVLGKTIQQHLETGDGHYRFPDLRGLIQLAQFIARSDLEPDLDIILSASTTALAMSDLRCAEELSRFALVSGGGARAAMVLATALTWQGRNRDSERVLADVDSDDLDEVTRATCRCMRVANLFWGDGEMTAARELLAEMKEIVTSKDAIALVAAMELTMAQSAGDAGPALKFGPALCEPGVPPLAREWAAMSTSYAFAAMGQVDGVQRIAETTTRAMSTAAPGLQQFMIGAAQVMVLTSAGDHQAADRIVEQLQPLAAGLPEASAMIKALLGLSQRSRGALSDACASFQDAIASLPRFPSQFQLLVMASAAQAEGARGNTAGAADALRRSEEIYGSQLSSSLPELELARAWEHAAKGEISTGRTHALRSGQIAHRFGMPAVEMRALHTAVRLGDRSHAARLTRLAVVLRTPMAEAVADHARGLADHDGNRLDAAADRFIELEALDLAADAAAQAAHEHALSSHRRRELESLARAQRLASECGLQSPAIRTSILPLPITDRESEVAMLVAVGLSNREIADRLSVSVRTVEGHLYRIFAKLDVEGREQLSLLVEAARRRM